MVWVCEVLVGDGWRGGDGLIGIFVDWLDDGLG